MKKWSKIFRKTLVALLVISFFYSPFSILRIPAASAANNNGMVIYGDAATAIPKYRTWDGTNFSGIGSAQTTVASVQYVVTKEAPGRNEKILGTMASTGAIHFQVWNGSTWGNLINPGAVGATNDAERGFDIAYEQISSHALIVYEKNTTSDTNVYYQVWDGASWGGEQTLTYSSGVNGNILWVKLEVKPFTDEVMLVTEDSNSDIRGIVWDGSSWVNEQLLTDTASIATSDPFDAAYENSSGDALVMYGTGTALDFWTYADGVWTDGTGGGAVCTETGTGNACITTAAAVHQVKLSPGRNNDYIAMILMDAGADVSAQIWNGMTWLGIPSAQATWDETAAELPSLTIRSRTVESAFETAGNRFMFAFADANALLVDYFFYDLDTGLWYTGNGVTQITDINTITTQTPTWTDDVETIRLDANPDDNSQIMITGIDLLNIVRTFLWNGSAWTTPTQSSHGTTGIDYMDGACFTWDFSNTSPNTPSNSTPSNGAANQLLTPALSASAFSDPDGNSHAASQWQVDNNSDFSSPEFDSGEDAANKTSITVSPAISLNTTYYWRVRYKDNSGKPGAWSAYSTYTSFTTTQKPATPTNTSPEDSANISDSTPTLESSAFSDPNGDSHAASQWQVTTVSGDYGSPIFDSGEDTTNKTSITVSPALAFGDTYYWHVRHKDNKGAWSDYSAQTSFNLLNTPPDTPTNTTPSNGATNQLLTPTLVASAFNDSNPGQTHTASQWQVTTVSGDYGSPIFDSGEDTTNKTSMVVSPALSEGTIFYWHVRYKDNSGVSNSWSSYSTEFSFTTGLKPNTPTNSAPINGATNQLLLPELTSSAFSDPNIGDNHAASQWQITTTPGNYGSPIFDSGEDATHKVSITVSPALIKNTTYYWHVRHKDDSPASLWSSYSSETSFTTTQGPTTPSNASPGNGTDVNTRTPTLESSAFSDPQGNSHAASQWQVTTVSGDYGSPVFDSGEDTTNKTSAIVSPALAFDDTYYWHVRHKNDKGAWSSYSTETSFNTVNTPPATPTNIVPTDGASLFIFPTLVSSAFSDPNGDGHAAAQWQVTDVSGNYSSPEWDSGEDTSNLVSVKVPSTLARDKVYYWHVRHKDNSGTSTPWSNYSTETSFILSEAAIDIKLGGQGSYSPGDSIELTAQLQDGATNATINDATLSLNIYNPSKTKVITSASMPHLSGSNGLYTYTYIAPDTLGSYIFDISAVASSTFTATPQRRGYNASAFSIAGAGGGSDVSNLEHALIAFTGTADSGTTLTLVDNALTQADDFWNGMTLIITGGTNAGEIRQITDFDANTDTITVHTAFSSTVDGTSTYLIRRDINWAERVWNYTARTLTSFGTLVADIWSYSTRTLTSFGSLAVDIWNDAFASTRRLTDKTLTGGGELATEGYIDQATSTVIAEINENQAAEVWNTLSSALTLENSIGKQLASNVDVAVSTRAAIEPQQAQWTVYLSDFEEIPVGHTYRTKLWILNYASIPTDAAFTPTVTLYDAERNIVAEGVSMTKISTGIYEYTYSVAGGATQGVWETVANAVVEVGKTIQRNDYWEVAGSPAQVRINSITDNIVPGIIADVTLSNEGSVGYEYQYEWCVVASENNACGGGDDVSYSSAAKYIQAGQDFNTALSATVSAVGAYWFKVAIYYGTEKSGASQTFTATTAVVTPPTPPGGGGGGGGGAAAPAAQPATTTPSTSLVPGEPAFCTTFATLCETVNAILGRVTGIETKVVKFSADIAALENKISTLEKKITALPAPAPTIIKGPTIIRQVTPTPPAAPKPRAKIFLETITP
jgi:hypothetical protein